MVNLKQGRCRLGILAVLFCSIVLSCDMLILSPQMFVNQLMLLSPPQWHYKAQVKHHIQGMAYSDGFIYVIGDATITRLDSKLENPIEYLNPLGNFWKDGYSEIPDPPGTWLAYLWTSGTDEIVVLYSTRTYARIFLFDSIDPARPGSALMQGSPTIDDDISSTHLSFYPDLPSQGLEGRAWDFNIENNSAYVLSPEPSPIRSDLLVSGLTQRAALDSANLYLLSQSSSDVREIEAYRYTLANIATGMPGAPNFEGTFTIPTQEYDEMTQNSTTPFMLAAETDASNLVLHYRSGAINYSLVFDRESRLLRSFIPSRDMAVCYGGNNLYFAAFGSIYGMADDL